MNVVLSIKNLSITMVQDAGSVNIVRDCNLELKPGEIHGLVGESGSGKSLTAMACLGLIPQKMLLSGSIAMDGQELGAMRHDELRALRGKKAAMIFQNPMTALNPYFTIESQMVAVIRQHFGVTKLVARTAAGEALEQAGLNQGALARYPHQMSGGQLQRVMIGMALACKPRVLIADEPTTALDVTVQARILLLLKQLADEGMAILLITHDLGVVAQVAKRASVMYAGSIVESGLIEDVFDNPGHPYTRGLIASVPKMGQGKCRLTAIDGTVPDFRVPQPGCPFQARCTEARAVCQTAFPATIDVSTTHTVRCVNAVTTIPVTVPVQELA